MPGQRTQTFLTDYPYCMQGQRFFMYQRARRTLVAGLISWLLKRLSLHNSTKPFRFPHFYANHDNQFHLAVFGRYPSRGSLSHLVQRQRPTGERRRGYQLGRHCQSHSLSQTVSPVGKGLNNNNYKLSKEFKVIILGDYGNVRGIYIQETRMQMNNRKLSKGVK